MKLFTVGPVQMYPKVADVRNQGIPYFRTQEYGDLVKNCLQELAKLLGTNYNDNILYLTASGTAAMEAVIDNALTQNDKALVINGGSFGHRFCELLGWHKIPYDAISLKWNESLKKEHLMPYQNKGYTVLLVNLHETSTGQLYDIQMLSDFCQQNNMFLIVDAISTFLADDYNMDKYKIDATIFSSQKGLCLSPGLSFVAMSPRMIEKIQNHPQPSSYYFNFKSYLENIKRGQTPFTPAVCVMYELNEILKIIKENGGKEAWLKCIQEKCQYFRQKASELGFSIVKDYPLSNMLTPLYFENEDAYEIFLQLQNKYRIYVNPCGGELAHKLFRVSHIGNTDLADIDDLLEKLTLVVKDMKND